MTIREFIEVFSINEQENILSVCDFLGNEIVSASFYDYTHNKPTASNAFSGHTDIHERFLYSVAHLVDFEIDPKTVFMKAIEVRDEEKPYLNEFEHWLRPKKYIYHYGLNINGAGTVYELNKLCLAVEKTVIRILNKKEEL